MTSSEDAPSSKPSPSLTSFPSSGPTQAQRSSNSAAVCNQPYSLPYRGNEDPLLQSLEPTLHPPHIVSVPQNVPAASGPRPGPYERSASRSAIAKPSLVSEGRSDEPRSIIVRAFVPHVAVYASSDTEDLIRGKGFEGGLLALLRCFGERIRGKVVIRDCVGASRGWDDFGIRFDDLGDGFAHSKLGGLPHAVQADRQANGVLLGTDDTFPPPAPSRSDRPMMELEEVVEHYLSNAPVQAGQREMNYLSSKDTPQESSTSTPPFFALYLRKLLSGMPMVAHETFSHPVACVIAISSHCPAPIDALRQLYSSTRQGSRKVPGWVSNEYLRYYILVHDEDKDDISKSTSLFEQMKRHFGLHCHLLRLRSSQCIPTDDDSSRVPIREWLAASEELSYIRNRGKSRPSQRDSYRC